MCKVVSLHGMRLCRIHIYIYIHIDLCVCMYAIDQINYTLA